MIKKAVAIFIIVLAIYWSFKTIIPSKISNIDAPAHTFSTVRALHHLKEISKETHFLGSESHERVRAYLLQELKALGIAATEQQAFSISTTGELSKPTNILARIKGNGNGKALLLMTHYDSEPHSSYGASDAGSGVVTILEGLRAFLSAGKIPENDIIVLFTDAEELGLNGADIFANQHPWAKDVGLALNFEARGSGGSSIMLVETNAGNANLIKGFTKAKAEFPLGNSLFYSIYKLLPNDTDLTVFREVANINGFNFAFVDDHFDYHTALDTYDRLDRATLQHQGSYIMAMLHYFANADLNALNSPEDLVYFNMPFFSMVYYPFACILPMLVLAIVFFILLIAYGFKRQQLNLSRIGKGFLVYGIALIGCGVLGLFGWKLLLVFYPEYNEILQGFTYNGHAYILAFIALALALCFWVYGKFYKPENAANMLVAPLCFWLAICTVLAFKLKGASFFILPVFFGLIGFFVLLRQKAPNLLLMALLVSPMLLLFSPMVQMFPVGLGLKMLVASTILLVLLFGLMLPVFSVFKHKKRWGYVCLAIGLWFLGKAHFSSRFTYEAPKPNSLVYVLDADDNSAIWATYDTILDDWTTPYFTNTISKTEPEAIFSSKYGTVFKKTAPARVKSIPVPMVYVEQDTSVTHVKRISLCVAPQRNVHRVDVYLNKNNMLNRLAINGIQLSPKGNYNFNNRPSNRLLTYYVLNNEPLELQFDIRQDEGINLNIYESSYDLLAHPLFKVKKRNADMIPKPFVLNDAVIVKKNIRID